jgi:hypothetical protein
VGQGMARTCDAVTRLPWQSRNGKVTSKAAPTGVDKAVHAWNGAVSREGIDPVEQGGPGLTVTARGEPGRCCPAIIKATCTRRLLLLADNMSGTMLA